MIHAMIQVMIIYYYDIANLQDTSHDASHDTRDTCQDTSHDTHDTCQDTRVSSSGGTGEASPTKSLI